MSRNFIYRDHVEPRVKIYSPREESFPLPLKKTYPELQEQIWMSNKNAASTAIGISLGHDICLILGQVSLDFLEEKPSKRIYVVRVENNEKTAHTQARSFMTRNLENNWRECQADGEAKVVG